MRRAGQSGFIAILAAEAEDKGAGRAKSDGVAEAQEKIAVTEIGARGGKSREAESGLVLLTWRLV